MKPMFTRFPATLALLIVLSHASLAQAPSGAVRSMGVAGDQAWVEEVAERGEGVSVVPSKMGYQGVLTENNQPVTGTRNIVFKIFTNSTCTGSPLQTITKNNTQVTNGLFSVVLDVTSANFNGQGLWLRVEVNAIALGCTEIVPAPYALHSASTEAIHGRPVSSSAPATNQILRWSGSQWAPVAENSHNHMGQLWTGTPTRGLEIDKSGSSGVGIYGTNSGSTGSAVVGDALSNWMGVWGQTNASNNNYGLYTPNNLFSLNFNLAGAIMFIVQNGGDGPITSGDVVSFAGLGVPVLEGGPPVARVSRTSVEASPAIAGVAYRRFDIEQLQWGPEGRPVGQESRELTSESPTMPGEYLLLCVSGPCQVQVSASGGPVRVGDPLVGSDLPGRAVKPGLSDTVVPVMQGAVIGKALQSLETGQGLIYVFLTTK